MASADSIGRNQMIFVALFKELANEKQFLNRFLKITPKKKVCDLQLNSRNTEDKNGIANTTFEMFYWPNFCWQPK